MMEFDRGDAVRVQSTHTTTTPFSTTETNYDPTSVTLTVKGPDGVDKITDQAMSNHATGQLYYILQTLTSWDKGKYTAYVTATGPTYDSEEVSSFTLL